MPIISINYAYQVVQSKVMAMPETTLDNASKCAPQIPMPISLLASVFKPAMEILLLTASVVAVSLSVLDILPCMRIAPP